MRFFALLITVVSTHAVLTEASVPYDPVEDDPPDPAAIKAHEDAIKYFHEPGTDDLLGHYDTRYFQGLLSYEDKRDTQVHMIRAYLDIFREKGIETWIAHGTLLGWWWNGKMLPWDWDIDTQVSESTLRCLATQMNNTLHTYTAASSDNHNDPITRTYLLDVNPFWTERQRGDGFNIIDARWIDVRNGLYIDITGLSETYPDVLPGVWSGKNLHRYKVTDLYPMRETMYEGVVTRVPYAYEPILTEEYTEVSLVRTEYEGHMWDSSKREWVQQKHFERS